MQVILLERVAKLGQMGDVEEYATALPATSCCRKASAPARHRSQQAILRSPESATRSAQPGDQEGSRRTGRKARRDGVHRHPFGLGLGAALYGSVTPRDIADAATAEGFSVDRRQVVLAAPIKALGVHGLSVVLHPEVEAKISVNVARSVEEAELQASGKSIQELAAEAEAEAEFEISELFDDMGGAVDEDADLS
ncbi:50S ribosomal protein L9 [Novosphingobium sp. MW5]|nr:50S ribosomal protein L9 [Novosphingobium sp. MW5]